MTAFHSSKTGVFPVQDVHVVDLSNRVVPHMSNTALKASHNARTRPGWSNDMVVVARMWDHEPDDDELRQLGIDISTMVEHFDVDGLISVPMLIPIPERGVHLVTLFARVMGAERPDVLRTLQVTLPMTCGLHVLEPGELPPVTLKRNS